MSIDKEIKVRNTLNSEKFLKIFQKVLDKIKLKQYNKEVSYINKINNALGLVVMTRDFHYRNGSSILLGVIKNNIRRIKNMKKRFSNSKDTESNFTKAR